MLLSNCAALNTIARASAEARRWSRQPSWQSQHLGDVWIPSARLTVRVRITVHTLARQGITPRLYVTFCTNPPPIPQPKPAPNPTLPVPAIPPFPPQPPHH